MSVSQFQAPPIITAPGLREATFSNVIETPPNSLTALDSGHLSVVYMNPEYIPSLMTWPLADVATSYVQMRVGPRITGKF